MGEPAHPPGENEQNPRFVRREWIGADLAGDRWRAHDLQLGRDVSVLELEPHAADRLAGAPSSLDSLRSVRAATIKPLLDVVRHGRRVLIVEEWVDGTSLSDCWDDLDHSQALRVAADVASALAELHRAHMCHGALRMSQVIVTPSGHGQLMGACLATLHDPDVLARIQDPSANPEYWSPEQVLGGAPDPASDRYALGVLLFELLTFSPPFADAPDGDRLAAARARGERRSPPVQSAAPDVPDPVATLVDALLDPDPSRRPQLDEVRATLERHIGSDDMQRARVRHELKQMVAERVAAGTIPKTSAAETPHVPTTTPIVLDPTPPVDTGDESARWRWDDVELSARSSGHRPRVVAAGILLAVVLPIVGLLTAIVVADRADEKTRPGYVPAVRMHELAGDTADEQLDLTKSLEAFRLTKPAVQRMKRAATRLRAANRAADDASGELTLVSRADVDTQLQLTSFLDSQLRLADAILELPDDPAAIGSFDMQGIAFQTRAVVTNLAGINVALLNLGQPALELDAYQGLPNDALDAAQRATDAERDRITRRQLRSQRRFQRSLQDAVSSSVEAEQARAIARTTQQLEARDAAFLAQVEASWQARFEATERRAVTSMQRATTLRDAMQCDAKAATAMRANVSERSGLMLELNLNPPPNSASAGRQSELLTKLGTGVKQDQALLEQVSTPEQAARCAAGG